MTLELWLLSPLLTVGVIVAGCLVQSRGAKGVLTALSLPGFFVLALIAAFFFGTQFGRGGEWVIVGLSCAALAICMLFVWKPFSAKTRRIAAAVIAALAVLTAGVFYGVEAYERSIERVPEDEVNLSSYMPFGTAASSATLAKSLPETSTLKLTENLPRLDGATALYPLYSAFARATYPQAVYQPYAEPGNGSEVVCSRTDMAFGYLIDGKADIAFLMDVSAAQREAAAQAGVELTLTPVGKEAFVFFVNADNPITNLSSADVRRIYSGQVTNWKDVGGPNDAIRAYQRPESSGSQVELVKIMDGVPIMEAPVEEVYSSMAGMYRAVADYRNYRNSLGYSFQYYIRDMIDDGKIKFLTIDGVAPTRETIASGQYPFALEFYAVTAKRNGEYLAPNRGANIDALLEWTKGPQGQYLVDETGYVPLR